MTTDRTQPARPAAPTDRRAAPERRDSGSGFAALLDAHAGASRGNEAPVRRDDRAHRDDLHGRDDAHRRDDLRGRDDAHRRNDLRGRDDAQRRNDAHQRDELAGRDGLAGGGDTQPSDDLVGRDVHGRGEALGAAVVAPAAPAAAAPAGQPAAVLPEHVLADHHFVVALATATPQPAAPATPAAPMAPAAPATALPPATVPAAVAAALASQPAAPAEAAPATGLPQATAPAVPATAPLAEAGPRAVPTAETPAATPAPASAPQDAPAPVEPTTPVAEPAEAPAPAQAPARPAAREPAATAPAPAAPTAEPVEASPAPTSQPSAPSAPQRAVPLHRAPAAVATLLHVAAERGITRARMALKPAELGGIEIRLQASAAGISAQVLADSPEAARLLAQAGDDLRRALEARDVTLISLEVATSGDERRESARGEWTDGDDAAFTGDRRSGEPAGDAEPTATTSHTVIELPGGLLVDVLA